MAFPEYTPEYENTLFTTIAEIEKEFSAKGVQLHLDDLDSNDPNYVDGTSPDATDQNYVTQLIQRSTSWVMDYLGHRFKPEEIYQLPRIREIATYYACSRLSRRRGNEAIFDEEVAEGITTLEDYQDGTKYIKASSAPRVILQSYMTDNRYFRNSTRVLQPASTSLVSGQHLAWGYPFYWL